MNKLGLILLFVPITALLGIGSFVWNSRWEDRLNQERNVTETRLKGMRENMDAVQGELRRVQADLDRLRDSQSLRNEIEATRPMKSVVTDDALVPASATGLEKRLRQVEESLASTSFPGDDEFRVARADKVRLRQVLDEVREDERVEKAERQAKKERQRIEERVEKLIEPLRLNDVQVDEMNEILWEENVTRNALFAEMRGDDGGRFGGGDREAIGDAMTEIRDKKSTALQETLDPWQYEEYQKTESRGGRGGRRGRDQGNDENGGGGRRRRG